VQGWTDAIRYIADHPEEARRMGNNARKLAELRALIHDTARLREAFGRIYEEVYRS